MTHTYATLEVSALAYDEIAGKLREAGYDHAFDSDGAIDMHGIGLVRAAPTHRHVKRGTLYDVLGHAELQSSGGPVPERAALTVYRGADDGKLWARPQPEFEDGRFDVPGASTTRAVARLNAEVDAAGVLDAWRAQALDADAPGAAAPFQSRTREWAVACFGTEIANDRLERTHRFLEEALELAQACGCTRSEASLLMDYVYRRPAGDPAQEVGGVMTTLAALCAACGLDMMTCAETELARIWTKVEAIRAKQAAKPKYSPLPAAVPQEPTP